MDSDEQPDTVRRVTRTRKGKHFPDTSFIASKRRHNVCHVTWILKEKYFLDISFIASRKRHDMMESMMESLMYTVSHVTPISKKKDVPGICLIASRRMHNVMICQQCCSPIIYFFPILAIWDGRAEVYLDFCKYNVL